MPFRLIKLCRSLHHKYKSFSQRRKLSHLPYYKCVSPREKALHFTPPCVTFIDISSKPYIYFIINETIIFIMIIIRGLSPIIFATSRDQPRPPCCPWRLHLVEINRMSKQRSPSKAISDSVEHLFVSKNASAVWLSLLLLILGWQTK